MFSFKSRVRYSELDKDQKLDLISIINYFQDCSTFQSEEIGKGIAYLKSINRVWLLNSWQIVVKRYPTLGEEITISTWAHDFKSMYGYRNFLLSDKDGNHLAYANSIWVYLDTSTNFPIKITPKDTEGYVISEPFNMEYAPRKIPLPKNLTTLSSFLVVRSNIDTNNHVNNGQYIKMAQEYLPDSFPIGQVRAEYKMSAVLGDTIVPMIDRNDNTITVVLANTEGNPFSIIEFTKL